MTFDLASMRARHRDCQPCGCDVTACCDEIERLQRVVEVLKPGGLAPILDAAIASYLEEHAATEAGR